MPYRRRRRRGLLSRKRRAFRRRAAYRLRRRRYRRRRSKYALSRAVTPTTRLMKFYYSQEFVTAPGIPVTADLPTVHAWHVNSLYDPDASGTGHQPKGFDQWTQFFTHYCVLGSKITVTFFPPTRSATVGDQVVSVGMHAAGGAPINRVRMFEDPEGTSRVLMTNSEPSSKPVTISRTFSVRRYFQVKDVQDDPDLWGAMGGTFVGSNPAKTIYFHISNVNFEPGTDPAAVRCRVSMQFIARLGRRFTAMSTS